MSKRLRFFVGHVAVSVCIALLVLGLVYGLWYPSPLAKAVGVTHIFLMLLAIDVILGPILGFVVYKESKKTLKFDLSVIILIQIAALVFGVYNIAQARPAWVVFNTDRFELIRNNDLVLSEKAPQDEFAQVSWVGPQWAAVKVTNDVQQKNEDLFAEALGGLSIAQRPERYIDIDEEKATLRKRALPLSGLYQYNDKQQVNTVLAKYPQANHWLPMKALSIDMVVLINKEKAEVIKIVDLRPWE
ncbi:type IV pilin accessory protein [Acinetobacter towneri]|uniref:TfpX/TfpZ family type IV pilin accessory protein n=1 Tax=Acinetobacter towneri TaxID=202956 RepID=UPI002DC02106|nr:TfpX/TfpZ family type IV pilin accessory protein [Acinetobacter towneri]MEB6565918.1 type IV pilin accessory protein [Acinetobacter towneri]